MYVYSSYHLSELSDKLIPLAIFISIIFFRGVGIVGHTKGPMIESVSEDKQVETAVSSMVQEKNDDGTR